MAIQIRRGSYTDLNANALVDGEFCATLSDDPNTSDGRAVYIKNGTLKRVCLHGESTYSEYQEIVSTTLNSSASSVNLFNTSSYDFNEYIIVINGAMTSYEGALWLSVGGQSGASANTEDYQNVQEVITINKLVGYDALIKGSVHSNVRDIENKAITLNSNSTIASGTTITVYAR